MTPASAVLAALLLLIAVPAASAPPPVERHPPAGDCRDDRLVDRCDPGQQRRVLELFAVQPIESHRDSGNRIRRAFYVDGYGRDVVAIELGRPKGGDPQLWVHFPPNPDSTRTVSLSAPVPPGVWNDLIERSRHFDRQIQPRPDSARPSGAVAICAHSWVYTVEGTDPPEWEGGQPSVRRRTEDACDDGLTAAYADALSKAAVALLAPCARLDPAHHRNSASLLSACRLLAGDRIAAADVLNRSRPFLSVREAADSEELESRFHYGATVDWGLEISRGSGTAPKFWTAKSIEKGPARFYYDGIEGRTAREVQLVGRLVRYVDPPKGGDSVEEEAPVVLNWTDEQGEFRVRSAVVGPFKRKPGP